MKPANLDLIARRNAPFAQVFTFSADLTGAVAKMQIRLYGAAPNLALIELEDGAEGFVDGLQIGDETITAFITEETLELLPRTAPGETDDFVYDLTVLLPGDVDQVWMQGDFMVKPGVTKRLPVLIDEDGDALTDEDGNILVVG